MTRPRVTPRPALSARQVDRVEREIIGLRREVVLLYRVGEWNTVDNIAARVEARLTRLLASVRRSERR